MGVISMSVRAIGVGLAAILLAGCPQADPGGQDRTTGPAGDTIICPGDSRCVDIFPIAEPSVPPIGAPQGTTCLVDRERVVVACPGNQDQRCPGPGCPDGQNPGQGGGPRNNCRITEHYYQLTCPPTPPVDGSGGERAQSAGDTPSAAAGSQPST